MAAISARMIDSVRRLKAIRSLAALGKGAGRVLCCGKTNLPGGVPP
jgi:hypothetical protein